MNRKLSSILLLLILSVTDAYLLAHPNLIGRIGVLVYKHSYIKNFPSALLTVALVVSISLLICELAYRFLSKKNALAVYLSLALIALSWFIYVYITFSTFSYRITGKAFIYGAHLLPVILQGMYARYFFKKIMVGHEPQAAFDTPKNNEKKPL
ncbi:hypothetical protein [Dyadobacter arcticus]|uniref:FlaA1/EpsC-like NDP-sugar epimerase n=1 Tax=Dyadobacter arcticus TaxID=1078754 RepID=A0ABX0UMN0_9BACT|nr:hypothetical protein [Dyadobacter arcticus]NIJ54187.1 FlaA1/EpsC-like NDP-sugar epimerase [Dyadobacter arcticus]